eukprot:10081_1
MSYNIMATLILISSSVTSGDALNKTFTIYLNESINNIPDEYLSVNIDIAWFRKNRTPYPWNNSNALKPTLLRVAGTAQDEVIYDMNEYNEDLEYIRQQPNNSFTINASMIQYLIEFTVKTGWKLTFGLNLQQRTYNISHS